MTILTIHDRVRNGKGGNMYVSFDHCCYIYECEIKDKTLLINKKIFNLSNISKVIFNFNEDLFTYNRNSKLKKRFESACDMVKHFKEIATLIKNNYSNITIYNDPDKCFDIGDKVLTYNRIKDIECDLFAVPNYKKISNIDDLISIDFFPCIIKQTNGSHTTDDTVCKTKEELLKAYNKHFKNKKNIFVVEFIDSYIQELDCNHCIRFMVTNNKLMEYHFRGTDDWNARACVQIKDKIKKCELFYEKIYANHKSDIENYFDKTHKIYGNGFYVYDVIYSEKQNKYYICEIGLKIFDDTYYNYSKKYIDKFSFNKKRLKEYYKNEINN